MAVYRCEVKSISRGQGRSCVAAAAYRHGTKLHDQRQNMTHAYEQKLGVEHSEIVAPNGAPEWVKDRQSLWNRADAAEKRKDAITAREVMVTLPRELSLPQQVEAVRGFCRDEFTAKGIVADFAIHAPDARDGQKQPHAHIMILDRPLDPATPSGLSPKKDRSLAQAPGVEAIRERWASHYNRALEMAHIPERVDHRSLASQHREAVTIAANQSAPTEIREAAKIRAFTLDRRPEPKIGPVGQQIERQGRQSYAVKDAMQARTARHQRLGHARAWNAIGQRIQGITHRLVGQLIPTPATIASFIPGLGLLRAAGAKLAIQDTQASRLRSAGQKLEVSDAKAERLREATQRQERSRARERSYDGPSR